MAITATPTNSSPSAVNSIIRMGRLLFICTYWRRHNDGQTATHPSVYRAYLAFLESPQPRIALICGCIEHHLIMPPETFKEVTYHFLIRYSSQYNVADHATSIYSVEQTFFC